MKTLYFKTQIFPIEMLRALIFVELILRVLSQNHKIKFCKIQ